MAYIYDILNWNPINTNSFNLLAKINIKPDIKLLELFKIAPMHNILCKIQGTNSEHYDSITYGKIDKSTEDDTYYITLDKVWWSYPDSNNLGKVEFLDQTVYKTIEYLTNPNASPIVPYKSDTPTLNLLYNDSEPKHVGSDSKNLNASNEQVGTVITTPNQFCSNPRMKLSDIFNPIGISLVLIVILYTFSKKLFK